MNRTTRWLPLSGVAFTVLMVAAAAAFPMPPGGDVTPASNPDWLLTHQDGVIVQAYLRALAAMAFLALSVAVAASCRRFGTTDSPLSGVALAGGVATGVLMLCSQAVGLAAALFVGADGSADGTRALGQLQAGFLDLSAVPAALLIGAAGVVALRTAMLPRWLAVGSLAGVPFALVDAASYDGGPLESVGLLGLMYFLAWSLLVGVQLVRAGSADDLPADPVAVPAARARGAS